jgi:twitching motility two-component system response regulator PilH
LARKVLLADDSVTAQNMGRRILVDAGYEVITVNNGSSALKKVTESKPDLIVLDVYMPGYGGLEVCQRIRESQETARIPVLLTVGRLEPFKAEEARRVKADAFIVKPFEASELLTALTKLEDKIVPQASGRKSGRSGKSFADEEPGASKEFGDLDSGWKNRLKIPPPHHPRAHETARGSDSELAAAKPSEVPESQQVQPQVPSETRRETKPVEPVSTPLAKEEQPEVEQETSKFPRAEESANENATATSGGENAESVTAAAEAQTEIEPTPAADALPEVVHAAPEDAPEAERKSHEEEVAAALASLAPANGHGSETTAAEAEALPATMAAAVAGQEFSGPRWIAQEVALTDDESALMLEQEMQKAFAAFAAADAARMSLSSSRQESTFEPSPSKQAEFVVSTSGQGPESAPQEPAPLGSVSEKQEWATAPSVLPDAVAPREATPSGSAREGAKEVAAYAAAASAGTSAAAVEAGPEANSHSTVTPEAPTPSESRHDSELAAAWASWKQVRESISGPEFTSQIADTAATGFKEIRHEESAAKPESEAAPPEESGAIASIVDSVLAELKPKLMEEISRKMKKDK